MDIVTFVLFVLGLGLLIVGGELLVRGSSSLAQAAGISPLVVGLTVVAFGTSAPELAVSVNATLSGQGAIAVGNVIGSNICNVLLILGVSAIVSPLLVSARLVRFDVPIMIIAAVLMLLVSLDGIVARWEGALLVAGLVSYFAYVVYASRRETMAFQADAVEQAEKKTLPEVPLPTEPRKPASAAARRRFQWVVHTLLIVAGLAALVVGARWLVAGAVMVAKSFGVSELIIGLTVVALGTSLPEMATSIIASFRDQRDIAVGNIVGSNIFNVLGILGITAVVHPVPVPDAALAFDLPVMLAVCVACLPIFFSGRSISRWEGALFFGYYIAYTAYLILASSKHAALNSYSHVMFYYVIPITAVTIVTFTIREIRGARRRILSPVP